MSSTPRGWPGVTVPEDHYDRELFAATFSAEQSPRRTHAVSRHRPHLSALWLGLAIALIATVVFGGGQLDFVRLLVVAAMWAVTSIGKRRDVVLADGDGSLLLHHRSSAATKPPTEVAPDRIVRIRPRSMRLFGRYFRPEVWQVGPERIIVAAEPLGALLAHHAQEATPS